jgi:hypothetical protein
MCRGKITLAVLVLALVAPAAATARAAVTGVLKQTVVDAYTERAGLDATLRQTACFGVWRHGD